MTYTPALGAEQDAVLAALQRCSVLNYGFEINVVDDDGTILAELDPVYDPSRVPTINRDPTATIAGRFDFSLDTDLVWGRDRVAPALLVSSSQYAGGEVQRFPQGAYVATTPSVRLRNRKLWQVTGYSLAYLLQSEVGDTFSAAAGATYADVIATLLDAAGIANARLSGHLNPAVVRFPADWAAKVIPTAGAGVVAPGPRIFPSDDSNSFAYLDIVNALLKESGMRSLSDDQLGRFLIAPIPTPETDSIRWTFSESNTAWDDDFAGNEKTIEATLNSDAWNLPNYLLYIQTGLSFAPAAYDGSDGRYLIQNADEGTFDGVGVAHYRPPSDQATVGRKIKRITRLDASGQSDLVTQAEKSFTDLFSSAESFDLTTAPWPAAWEFDVFRVASANLPRVDNRKVAAQSWTLPLSGAQMTWKANSVGSA